MAEETAGLSVTAIFPSGGVPAWNVCCSSSLRARGGQVIPLQFPPLAGQRGGGCCCFVQARGSCVHSLQLTPTHGERQQGGGGGKKKQGTNGWWFVARGFAFLAEGQRFGTLEAVCSVCLMLKLFARGAEVPRWWREVWPVLSPSVEIRCREKSLQAPEKGLALCVLQRSGLAGCAL